MVDTGMFKKIGLIFKFLNNNSLLYLVLLLLVAIVLDLGFGKNSKSTKRLYVITIILILLYGVLEYYKPFFNIIDVYITNVFKLAYFPSIIEYTSMILITIFIEIISIKRFDKIQKYINIIISSLIELLFIINIAAMKNIKVDLLSITSIYENDLLLSIFQITGFIFIIWLIINIIIFIINILTDDGIEIPKLNNDYE